MVFRSKSMAVERLGVVRGFSTGRRATIDEWCNQSSDPNAYCSSLWPTSIWSWKSKLDSDAEVLRYIVGRARSSEEVLVVHDERMADGRRVDGLGFWMAFDGDDFVGLCMLPPGDKEGEAELGYRIPRRQWRRGYASEASRALLAHAFETVGLQRVFAQTMVVNDGSKAVMRSVGLRYVRTFHEVWEHPLPGAEQGDVAYEITSAQWAVRI